MLEASQTDTSLKARIKEVNEDLGSKINFREVYMCLGVSMGGGA